MMTIIKMIIVAIIAIEIMTVIVVKTITGNENNHFSNSILIIMIIVKK